MSFPDEFLILMPLGDNWMADVLFLGGRAGGIGPTQIEAMEAALDDIDLISRDLCCKRTLLERLIDRSKRLPQKSTGG
jgi:hypothetical protein